VTDRTLYLVTCGAPLASRIGDGVHAAREHGWNPYVIPTDAALPWLEDQDLADVPVLTGNRTPGEPKRTPNADAVAVVPTTFNTSMPGPTATPTPIRLRPCALHSALARPLSPFPSPSTTSRAIRPGSPRLQCSVTQECE
jgi:hypothetical protein